MNKLATGAVLLALAGAQTPAIAQVAPAAPAAPAPGVAVAVSPNLLRRSEDVVRLINNEVAPTEILAASFLAKAPADRVVQLAGGLRQRFGRAVAITSIEAIDANQANIRVSFERAELSALLQVEGNEEARIEGLRFERPDRAQ